MTHERPPFLLRYWRQESPVVNLGDYLSVLLFERLGIPFEVFSKEDTSDRPVMLAIGTMLAPDWYESVGDRPVMVWGSGWGGISHTLPERVKPLAVRGPVTRDFFNLPQDTPLGDPALLLSCLIPNKEYSQDVVLVPHHSNEAKYSSYLPKGVNRKVSMMCRRSEAVPRIRQIASARFILSNSLHGLILAQAYRKPWALYLEEGDTLNFPPKFDDWFAYLGTSTKIVASYEEAKDWWQSTGKDLRTPDLTPLLRSLPDFRVKVR